MADLGQYGIIRGVRFHVHEESLYIQVGSRPGMPLDTDLHFFFLTTTLNNHNYIERKKYARHHQ